MDQLQAENHTLRQLIDHNNNSLNAQELTADELPTRMTAQNIISSSGTTDCITYNDQPIQADHTVDTMNQLQSEAQHLLQYKLLYAELLAKENDQQIQTQLVLEQRDSARQQLHDVTQHNVNLQSIIQQLCVQLASHGYTANIDKTQLNNDMKLQRISQDDHTMYGQIQLSNNISTKKPGWVKWIKSTVMSTT